MIKVHQKIFLVFLTVLLLLPLSYLFGTKDKTVIFGVENITPLPSLQEKNWNDRNFQQSFEAWWNSHFGFRKFFLKTKNTIYDMVNFGEFHAGSAGNLIQGKSNVLYNKVYFLEYNKKCPTVPQEINQLIKLKQNLRTFGIDLFVVIAPNKVATHFQHIPEWIKPFLGKRCQQADAIAQKLQKLDIPYYNTQPLMEKLVKTAEIQPFNKGGIHWNYYGATKALQLSLQKFGLGKMHIAEIEYSDKPILTERDIAKLLNRFIPYRNIGEKFANPIIKANEITSKKIAILGDSFSQEYKNNLLKIYPKSFLLYYGNMPMTEQEIRDVLKNSDVIILIYTSRNIIEQGNRFYKRVNKFLSAFEPVYQFSQDNEDVQLSGFSNKEPWGRWTDAKLAKSASVVIKNIINPHKLLMTFDIMPLVKQVHPKQEVDIYANGKLLDTWVFLLGDKSFTKQLEIPAELISPGGILTLELDVKYPASPRDLKTGDDARLLGIGIKTVKYRYEE